MTRARLDVLVVQHGLVKSREQAHRLIMAGQVRVDGVVQTKPGHTFDDGAHVELEKPERFVSRGGEKLDAALEHFGIGVKDLVCLDIGASHGGFTDCLLQRGAAKVYAVDVGHGQLDWRLRNDPRVVVMEGVNARYLKPEDLPEQPAFASMDVAFISLTKVLPAVTQVLAQGARMVTLIKPQFEAGPENVSKGGVVRSATVRDLVVRRIEAFGTTELGLRWHGVIPSPIRGPAGNVEFLALWEKP
ncbi:MAG: TlyA family RNA methyltransferase [Kiritimatiellae bacterium]|nr:TlyA family RNA methyltransferase [Kiritimatiellia bacterium]